MDMYGKKLATSRKKHLEAQSARFVSEGRNFERAKSSESAARAGAAWDKRVSGIQERKEHVAGLVVNTVERQRSASGRRADWLQVRSVGPQQLHTSRDLAAWQAKRLASLR